MSDSEDDDLDAMWDELGDDEATNVSSNLADVRRPACFPPVLPHMLGSKGSGLGPNVHVGSGRGASCDNGTCG